MKNEKNIRNRLSKRRYVKKIIEIDFSRDDIETEEDDIEKSTFEKTNYLLRNIEK